VVAGDFEYHATDQLILPALECRPIGKIESQRSQLILRHANVLDGIHGMLETFGATRHHAGVNHTVQHLAADGESLPGDERVFYAKARHNGVCMLAAAATLRLRQPRRLPDDQLPASRPTNVHLGKPDAKAPNCTVRACLHARCSSHNGASAVHADARVGWAE